MTFSDLLTEEDKYPDIVDLLAERSDESEYWEKCYDFFIDNRNEDLEDMTEKQAKWATRISEDMAEYRIKQQRK